MAEEGHDPRAAQVPTRAVLPDHDRIPGQRDMSMFERVLAGPAAVGPRLQWAVVQPDGRTIVVDTEDEAIAIARGTPTCRIARRYVTPWVMLGPSEQ